jgi:hypothetical protein
MKNWMGKAKSAAVVVRAHIATGEKQRNECRQKNNFVPNFLSLSFFLFYTMSLYSHLSIRMLYAGLPSLAFKRFLNTNTKPPNLQQYVESMTSCASSFPQALIEGLEAETRRQFEDAFKMVSIHQAHVIYSLTRMIRPQNVLEIGTFTGMSTLSMAAGTNGNIITIERDAKPINIARMWLEQAKVADRVRIEEGVALDMLVISWMMFEISISPHTDAFTKYKKASYWCFRSKV